MRFIRLATAWVFATIVAGWIAPALAPALAQNPAMEFLTEQMRQRDEARRQQQLRQQREYELREQRRLQRERARRLEAAQWREVSDQSPPVEERPKNPNARVLLVIGDEMAEGLAQGLREAFATEPMVIVAPLIRPESGLIPRPGADWLDLAREALRADPPPLAVVIMLGLNDRRPFLDGGRQAEPFSERWRELYQARLSALLGHFAARRVPVYVTGLPAMREPTLATDASFLNDILKAGTFAASAGFVDVWEGFVDEEGRYVPIGPDQNGNPRRLRRPDGIGLTPAGNRKLAFYVETALRGDLGLAAPAEEIQPAPILPPPTLPPPALPPIAVEPTQPYVGPVVRLTPTPAPSGGELGAAPRRAAADLATRILVGGEPIPPRRGRADDFRWPPDDAVPRAASAGAPPIAR